VRWLVAAGVEHIQWTPPKRTPSGAEGASSHPWSHGLLMSGSWSAVAAAAAARVDRDRRTAAVIGLLVASHWLLDVLTHAPDLPLAFDRFPKVGLGLEYSLEGKVHWRRALVAEMGLLAAGIAIDRRSRP
jgi:hypothetical protein